MTDQEKVVKFYEIQRTLWEMALSDNPIQATVAAAFIRVLKIESPKGEDPEGA